MKNQTIYKTVCQYSSQPLSFEDMEKLSEIARDYRAVKQYIYKRYGGVKSFSKLYNGFEIQNEMTNSGLRERFQLPSVYFYLAVREAAGNLKTVWETAKKEIRGRIRKSDRFSPEERHYLYYVLRLDSCYQQVLLYQSFNIPENLKESLRPDNLHRLDNYLRRQTRKCLKTPSTSETLYFKAAERAYRYADRGIYLSTKAARKRVFVPLTDQNRYSSQITVRLNAEERTVVLYIPVKITIKEHRDYENEIGVSMGYSVMLTSSAGNQYGEQMGAYFKAGTDLVREHRACSGHFSRLIGNYGEETPSERQKQRNIKENNMGDKKYLRKRQTWEAGLKAYINQELNRLIREEKPSVIYMPHMSGSWSPGSNKIQNSRLTMWRRGYIRRRLQEKCEAHSIRFVEVFAKNISRECSRCGGTGRKADGYFLCRSCGCRLEEKVNTARNAQKRGHEYEDHNTDFMDKY